MTPKLGVCTFLHIRSELTTEVRFIQHYTTYMWCLLTMFQNYNHRLRSTFQQIIHTYVTLLKMTDRFREWSVFKTLIYQLCIIFFNNIFCISSEICSLKNSRNLSFTFFSHSIGLLATGPLVIKRMIRWRSHQKLINQMYLLMCSDILSTTTYVSDFTW